MNIKHLFRWNRTRIIGMIIYVRITTRTQLTSGTSTSTGHKTAVWTGTCTETNPVPVFEGSTVDFDGAGAIKSYLITNFVNLHTLKSSPHCFVIFESQGSSIPLDKIDIVSSSSTLTQIS